MEEPNPPKLEINGKCLAYHGPLLYEAKILKTHQANSTSIVGPEGKEEIDSKGFSNFPEAFMGKTCFYVHYKGWKPKWDEWVTVERLLVLSTDNLQLQKDLRNRTMQKLKKPQKAVTPKLKAKLIATPAASSEEKNANGKAKPKRIKDCVLPELLKQETKDAGFEISVSVALKELLVDDWERITKENKLVDIPSRHPVKDICNTYQSFVLEGVAKHSAFYDNTLDFFQGLRVYFNTTLASILLYQFERKQLKELMNTSTEPLDYSSIYGPTHLLRLLVTLPSLISQTKIDSQSLDFFKTTLNQLLLWLHKNIEQYFVDDYINTSPSYEALARI